MERTAGVGALILGLVLAGCGDSRSPAAPATFDLTVDRLAIARQLVTAALGGFVGGPAASNSDDVHLGDLDCLKTCAGAACSVTCPIDERLDCPAGGSATDKGQVTGTLDAELSGAARLDATQTYSRCRPKEGLTVDGAPGTTATGDVRFVKGELADDQSVRVAGSVQVASGDATGRCDVDLRVTFSASRHGSAHGTVCGETVATSF